MPRGGHAHSGPAPDPSALRRERDKGEWTELPAEGRDGPVPDWPLSKATKRELELWADQWSRPQALMWERNGQELEVAMFVRAVRIGEQPSAPTNARTLVRQLMDSLGLTVPGMRSLRWKIVAAESKSARRTSGTARDRLRVVQDAG